jgi:thiol:disulfide interchange protein DsbD
METVKQAFGVLLLATALWFARTLLPEAPAMLGWGALALALGQLLGAFAPASGAAIVRRTRGLALVLWGAAILVGAAAGSRDPLAPLAGLRGGASSEEALAFRRVATLAELDAALAQARAEQRPALLDFYADWCVACKEMERYTFSDPAVRDALAGAVLLQADVTANSAADQALLARFGLFGPPTTLLFGADGTELTAARAVGYVPAAEYATLLRSALGR